MRRLALLAFLLAVSGCDAYDGRTSELELVVDQTRFTAGDEALVVLDNDTGEERTFSPCLGLVARRGEGYAPLGEPGGCPDIAATIRAGQSIPFRVRLPADLAPGMYAVALDPGMRTGVVGTSVGIVTGLFEVVPAE